MAKSKQKTQTHDRSALIQWLALVLVAALGLVAAFVFSEGGGNTGRHGGAVVSHIVS